MKFSKANTKLQKLQKKIGRKVYSFDLLAGWTCPSAHDCLSKVVDNGGKRTVKDGKHTQFRCYAASLEALYPSTYNSHKRNTDAVKGKSANTVATALQEAMPKNAGVIRIHSSGDLFNKTYFKAWILLAKRLPNVTFYAYTKQIKLWVELRHLIPKNLVLTASYGGKHDDLIDQHNLKSAEVVYSREEAEQKGIPIDEDDSYAVDADTKRVGLLIHGAQPAGSAAAGALQRLRKEAV